jgi:hypothetical protein
LLKTAPKEEAAPWFSAAHLGLLELVMKRIVQFLASALLLTLAAAPARSLNITASVTAALSDAIEASRALINRSAHMSRADFVISKFDERTIQAFGTAWRRSGNGSQPLEGVVLILQMADGGYSGREMGSTNEHKRFTFRWHPATIAIVHTHPNSSDPRPQDEDLLVAQKYQVPIFTITSRGMYVYDPRSKKMSKVMNNLDWLEISNWRKGLFARQ